MKVTSVQSEAVPEAVGGYSQSLLVEGPRRFLFVSGQIPESREGEIPEDFDGQCHQVWKNVLAQLDAAGMTTLNLVKVTMYLSSRRHAVANSRIRREYLRDHRPALTVIITGLFDENWLLEVEAVAAS